MDEEVHRRVAEAAENRAGWFLFQVRGRKPKHAWPCGQGENILSELRFGKLIDFLQGPRIGRNTPAQQADGFSCAGL
jgi:hypothetical protein